MQSKNRLISNKQKLKEAKLKVTRGRIAILNALAITNLPLNVNELSNRLNRQHSTINPVTIYRILNRLKKKGLVREIDFKEGKYRYELEENHHHHLVCNRCGTVENLEGCSVEKVEQSIKRTHNFLIKQHTLEFFGLCKNCLSSSS